MLRARINATGEVVDVRPYQHEVFDFMVCRNEGLMGELYTRDELTIIGDNEIITETKFNFNSVPQIWDDYKALFVFNDDGRVSCKLSFYNDTPQDAVISDLYVHESIRRQGGATAILNWCFECAKDRGCNSVSLRSDNDDWVREWYKRIGFEVESSQVWLKKEI